MIGVAVLSVHASVQQTSCKVISRSLVNTITFEPLDCHCVDACYYDSCGGTAKPGPCCVGGCSSPGLNLPMTQCVMDNLYNTWLHLNITYHDVVTDLNLVDKRRGNFTPEDKINPKVGDSVTCWYYTDNWGFGHTLTLHSYQFDYTPDGLKVIIGICIVFSGLFAFILVHHAYAPEECPRCLFVSNEERSSSRTQITTDEDIIEE